MNTPILFLIFNRPNETREVLNVLKIIKPNFLYVACDGPRENIATDADNVNKTREILKDINWDCELKTLFREVNLGCKKAVSEGIDWFFKNVEKGIILEDDCIPSCSFFNYCSDLLNIYRDDTRIMHISGLNFLSGPVRLTASDESYHFSKYAAVWGWATWRRAWRLYDVDIISWPKVRDENLHFNFSFNNSEIESWKDKFDKVYKKQIDTWDYQWSYCIFMNNGLCITPNTNLISNIGFNENATHTFISDIRSHLPLGSVNFPLSHPSNIVPDYNSDWREFVSHIRTPAYKKVIKSFLTALGLFRLFVYFYNKILNYKR